jgi:aminoglycoside 6'-N-acetyltransferase
LNGPIRTRAALADHTVMATSDIHPTLRGERLQLRPALAEDAQAIADILAEPEVIRWWRAQDIESVRKDLGEAFAIVVDGAVAGWLLYTEETEPDYRHVGLDIALSTQLQNRGYGREALRVAIRYFIGRGHHRFTIDPATHNERAIRAYQGVGFKPVGVMRAYERGADGIWHDGLLMDLVVNEFDG